jgi:hypothetical protein
MRAPWTASPKRLQYPEAHRWKNQRPLPTARPQARRSNPPVQPQDSTAAPVHAARDRVVENDREEPQPRHCCV